jgi:hypothetical protein
MAAILFLVNDQACKESEAMQTQRIVSQLLQDCAQFMHAKRLRALREVCSACVAGGWLSLTLLAFSTARATTLRHRVKCVDRLLGNAHLESERRAVYEALAHRWLADLPQLLIVVDWSALSADMQWQWLRASVVVEGRSVTLYEEVHPLQQLTNRGVHARFLERLAQLLPPCAHAPIVITDAGFRSTWFELLAKRNWYWIGRIRNRDYLRQPHGTWLPAKALYAHARSEAQDLGRYECVRSKPIVARLVLIKQEGKGRKCRSCTGTQKRSAASKKIASRNREPWLLSCSPQLSHLSAQAIVNLYAQRMRIEQQFRDTKNCALGMGLRRARSTGVMRLQALLLIAHVASLAKRLIGEAAKAQNLQLQLMSTARKDRAEISVMTLATRVIAQPNLLRSLGNVWPFFNVLRRQTNDAFACYAMAA